MTLDEVKIKLFDLASEYFAPLLERGNLIWGRSKLVNPGSPMVALTIGAVTRASMPIRTYINGIVHDSWPSNTTLYVELFTKGEEQESDAENQSNANDNTALNDLTDFVNFLNSVYVDQWSYTNDIAVSATNIRDLSAIVNVSSRSYRAAVEVSISFTQHAAGHTMTMYEAGLPFHSNGTPMYDGEGYPLDTEGNRIPDMTPLPSGPDGKFVYPPAESTISGGRSQELADMSTGYFKSVEIEHKREVKTNGKQS